MKYSFLKANKANYIALIAFVALSAGLLHKHEPWRDEAQAWLIARDCPNVGCVINQMHYERSPALWHLILFPLTHSGLPYFSIKVVHFLITLCAMIIFFKYAPFSTFQKILFLFGYFIFYEYNIIVRSYSLSILFLFLIAHIYKNRFKKTILYSILLFFLFNTNPLSYIIAIVLSGAYILEIGFNKNIFTSKYILSLAIISVGFAASTYQLLPADDFIPDYTKWDFDFRLSHICVIFNSIIGAFLPIPQFNVNFWDTKLLYLPIVHMDSFARNLYILTIGLVLFLLSLGFFNRKFIPMLIYTISSTGFFCLFFLRYPGESRHHGMIFIMFIFSLWIAKEYKDKIFFENRIINWLFTKRNLSRLFVAMLSLQVIASFVACNYELKHDFSAGKMVASFLRDNGFINTDTLIATYKSYAASSILPYLPRAYSQFYYIEYKKFNSFMTWNKEFSLNEELSINEIVKRVDNAALEADYSTVLFISNGGSIEKTLISTGSEYYSDRNYTIKSQPAGFENYSAILTSNDEKYATDDSYINLTLREPSIIYVAYDRRATKLPEWLQSFDAIPEKVYTTDIEMGYFNLYQRKYAPGSVTLGGNRNSSGNNGAESNYIVYVTSHGFELRKRIERYNEIAHFGKTVVRDESFRIYQVEDPNVVDKSSSP